MNRQLLFRPDHLPSAPEPPTNSLFERAGWFYAFLRRRVVRNDTEAIARDLQLDRRTSGVAGTPTLLEIGCGPGFYACGLARRFPGWEVLGLDRSHDQLRRARQAAGRSGLRNCRFAWSNALALDRADASADGLIASRLFTVLREDELPTALAEMHRVLQAGGRCFVAEPRSRWRAGIALRLLRLSAGLTVEATGRQGPRAEPRRPTVLAGESFHTLMASQPWAEVRCWEDGHYQYALARKAGEAAADPVEEMGREVCCP